MRLVNVKRAEVLKRIKANREEHRKIVHEALDGYRKAVIAELDKMIAVAKEGRQIITHVALLEPQDHTNDYDAVIDMMEMSTDDVIEITDDDFRSYVRDEWHWQTQFLSSNSMYSHTATVKMSSTKGK